MKIITPILLTIFAHTTIFAQEGSLKDELPVIKTSKAFKQMQQIVGKWKGKMKQSDGKIIDVETEYKVIANGSAGSSAEFTDWSEALFQNQYYRLIVGRVINLTNAPIKKLMI